MMNKYEYIIILAMALAVVSLAISGMLGVLVSAIAVVILLIGLYDERKFKKSQKQ